MGYQVPTRYAGVPAVIHPRCGMPAGAAFAGTGTMWLECGVWILVVITNPTARDHGYVFFMFPLSIYSSQTDFPPPLCSFHTV